MERIFILDRSGSMDSCLDDTIGGFNAFVREQIPIGGTLTLVLFDHEYTSVYSRKPINEVEPLTRETFMPRGSTALMDAIGRTIKDNWSRNRPTVVILTDGQENSSHQYTKAHIKDLIEERQREGWTFVYLGANQDAFAEAGGLGIASCTTVNYDTRRTPDAFRALSTAMSQASNNSQPLNFNTQIV
jgi:uncharacterized protein YegL